MKYNKNTGDISVTNDSVSLSYEESNSSREQELEGNSLLLLLISIYRTRAIITRGLYLFYPIFHCGLYLREVYTAERLVIS